MGRSIRGRGAVALVALLCATWALVAVAPSAGAVGGGTVSGTVTGAGGVPVTGASVGLSDVSGSAGSASTDEAGHYVIEAIPPGSYQLTVHAGGYLDPAPITLTVADGVTTTQDVTLQAAGAAHVTVRSKTGALLPGARVFLQTSIGIGGVQNWYATDNGDGTYDVGSLTAGTYRAIAKTSGDPSVGAAVVQEGVVISEGTTTSLELQLVEPGALQGTVMNGLGDPIAGVSLSLVNSPTSGYWQATTGASGQYSFPAVDPGALALSVQAPGYAPENLTVAVPPGPGVTTQDVELLAPGQINASISTNSSASYTFVALVACPGSADPLVGQPLVTTCQGFAADSSQPFELPNLSPGTYTVAAAYYSGSFGSLSVEAASPTTSVTLQGGDVVDCVFVAGPGGSANCLGGPPPATGTVVVTIGETAESYASGLCLAPGLPILGSTTCSDGSSANVRFGLLPGATTTYSLVPGTYTGGLAALSPTLTGGAFGPVDVTADTTVHCTFTMAAAPSCVYPNADGDGVDEDPVVDGNGDGTPDAQQANVTTLPAGAGGGALTIAAPGSTYTLGAVSATAVPASPAVPVGAVLPLGLVSFEVHLPNGVTTADVDVYTPPGTNPTSWFKLQHGAWSDFTGNATFAGDKVTLHLVDGGAGDADGAVNGVIVDPSGPGVNTPPTATTDSATVAEDGSMVVDVAGNDSANEAGQTVSVTSVGAAAHGTTTRITSGADAGKVRYVPAADYSGTDSFTYDVCDDGVPAACATGIVDVDVTPVNDAPRARIDVAGTDEDTPVVIDVLRNDDPGPQEGSQTLAVTQLSDVLLGNASVITTGPDAGKVRFVPSTDRSGFGGFLYKACDDGVPVKCDASLVLVGVAPVNDAPTISATPDKTVKKNKSLSVTVDVGDVDNSASSITVAKTSSNATLIPNGNIEISGSGSTRTVKITPASNKTGTSAITLTARDPWGATSSDQFTVSVTN